MEQQQTTQNTNITNNTTNITNHLADLVTDADGAHGFKVEEGNFTPYLTGSSDIGTFTPVYSDQIGKYTLQNKIVTFKLKIVLSSYTGTFNGTFRIAGLPFVSANEKLNIPIALGDINNINMDSTAKFLTANVLNNASTIGMAQVINNATLISAFNSNLGQTFSITISGQYKKV